MTAGLPAAVTNARVETFSVLHDGDDCVIAFFRSIDQASVDPLEVLSSQRASSRWIYAKVEMKQDIDRSPVSEIEREGDLIIVSLAYTLDDYAIPILDSNLKHLGTIYGTYVRTWPNGLLQFDLHQPHFGPHSVKIGVFDPQTGTDRQIYPFTPCDPARETFVRAHQKAKGIPDDQYGGDYCWAEASSRAPFYFDWRTNALAFAIELFYEYADLAWDQRARLMVTCEGLGSIASIQCHETPLEAWQTARPDLTLTQLVTFAAGRPRYLR